VRRQWAVQPCNDEAADSSLARGIDPKGKGTIGILVADEEEGGAVLGMGIQLVKARCN